MMPSDVGHRGRNAHVWTEALDAAFAASALSGLKEPQDGTVLPDNTATYKIALDVEVRITSYAT
jgi:hypothetical protein